MLAEWEILSVSVCKIRAYALHRLVFLNIRMISGGRIAAVPYTSLRALTTLSVRVNIIQYGLYLGRKRMQPTLIFKIAMAFTLIHLLALTKTHIVSYIAIALFHLRRLAYKYITESESPAQYQLLDTKIKSIIYGKKLPNTIKFYRPVATTKEHHHTLRQWQSEIEFNSDNKAGSYIELKIPSFWVKTQINPLLSVAKCISISNSVEGNDISIKTHPEAFTSSTHILSQLKSGRFYWCSQPIVRTDGELEGVELLVRDKWERLSALQVIALFDIHNLQKQFLSRLINYAKLLLIEKYTSKRVFINCDANQLLRLSQCIQDGFSGSESRKLLKRLCIEISENSSYMKLKASFKVIYTLRSLGVNFYLDDCNEGNVTLPHLFCGFFHGVKVTNHDSCTTAAIVNVLLRYGFAEIVIERVETAEQRDYFLRSVACNSKVKFQGYAIKNTQSNDISVSA